MLYESIKHIYPTIKDSEFILQDDGQGPYIKLWKSTLKQPTAAELQAVLPAVQTNLTNAEQNAPIVAKLAEIDIKSIRAIREYIASRPDAPQFTKDLDAQAVAERAKLKR